MRPITRLTSRFVRWTLTFNGWMVEASGRYGLADQTSMKKFMKVEDAAIIEHFFAVWKQSYDVLCGTLKGWVDRKAKTSLGLRMQVDKFANTISYRKTRSL